MKRINHTIKRKKIPEVKLVSLIEPSWYDYRESDENLISWNEWDYLIKYALNDVVGYNNLKFISLSNNNINNEPTINSSKWEEVPSNTELSNNKGYIPTGLTPDTGFLIFNVTGGTVNKGYYKWNTPTANTWNLIVGAPKTNLTNLSNRNPNDENSQPITGTILFNTGTTYLIGYYEWNTPTSNSWNLFNQTSGNTYDTIQKVLNQKIYDDFQLPLFLEATADEMGDMVDFDKNIQHNKISTNFTYNCDCVDNNMTITIDNTTTYQLVNIIQANNTNPDGSPIGDITFTVYWGDDTTSPININGTTGKTFSNINEKTVTIVFDSPYLTDQITKVVNCGDTYIVATELEKPIITEQDNSLKIE